MLKRKTIEKGSAETAFLRSAMTLDGQMSRREFDRWLAGRRDANQFDVARIPFSRLDGWTFEPGTGNLAHRSGKFFRIEGIDVTTNFGPTRHWMQPIINQPEIGILGFLVKKFDGVLHFLVQAKMEPGNVNLLQISPTVQATRSNYTQVHGGARPRYLEHFLDTNRAKVIVDQLQSEQGARFLWKRNRNMIVEVPEGEPLEVHEDFCWLTLGQIHQLLRTDNLVNMDSRTVLSCIRFAGAWMPPHRGTGTFADDLLASAMADDEDAWQNFDSLVAWLTHLKTTYELEVRRVPLQGVEGWEVTPDAIRHRSGRFFSVVAVEVKASNREVTHWRQPLIESAKGGLLAFVCQKRNGVLHFLVQGRLEPGNLDSIEMAPTVQCTPTNYDAARPEALPPFYDVVKNARPEQIRYRAIQSEEGGRFYHDQNQYLIVEIPEAMTLEAKENYNWMTLRQMKEFIRFNNYFNIESRGLTACLALPQHGGRGSWTP